MLNSVDCFVRNFSRVINETARTCRCTLLTPFFSPFATNFGAVKG